VAVETGSGDEVCETFDVNSSRCSVVTEEVATITWSVSALEEARGAMDVGEGVFGGRAKVCDILVASGEKTNILVAVEAMIPLSSDHIAVIGEDKLTFLMT